jgi:nucleotide-binding universal stress UspA family protein
MLKTILVPVRGSDSDAPALESAYLSAQIFQAHLDCLYVRRDPVETVARTAALNVEVPVIAPEIWETLEEQEKAGRDAAHMVFSRLCADKRIGIESSPGKPNVVSAAWHETIGDFASRIVSYGRVRDLIVTARAADPGASLAPIGEILVQCGRPLLLAPQAVPNTFATRIAVAWKDTAEAARALTASMPFLGKAKKVVILSVDEGDGGAAVSAGQLQRTLAWHDIDAEQRLRPKTSDTAADLLEAAAKEGADLMVMGGYGHSRAREFVFGGVTRRVLYGADLPVLLCH